MGREYDKHAKVVYNKAKGCFIMDKPFKCKVCGGSKFVMRGIKNPRRTCIACELRRGRSYSAYYKEYNKRYRETHVRERKVYEIPTTSFKCKKCGGTEFKIYKSKYPQRTCVNCKREWRKAYHLTRLDIDRGHLLKGRYKITLENYDAILAKQNGKCAICGSSVGSEKRGRLFVDHDHETGMVRGLLCHKCNVGIENFSESMDLLKNAIEYIRQWQGNRQIGGR